MEKIIKRDIVVEKVDHVFYCDCCNKEIGRVTEYEDGYYPETGKVTVRINDNLFTALKKINIEFTGTLCEDCRFKLTEEIEKMAQALCDKFHLTNGG